MFFWKERKDSKTTGQKGEDLAMEYLQKEGYRILERNFCNSKGRRMGEIDIIAEKEKELVFVEVKTRELLTYGDTLPDENINRQKLHKMAKIAHFYVQQKDAWDRPYHFDAVSVWINIELKKAKIKHLKNIFI